jgi:hypothetical protein
MNKIWRSTNSKNTCPSCVQLHGQVHSETTWENAGLHPGADSLMCRDGCNCTLTDTDETEQGSLSSVPLRGAEHLQGVNMTDIALQLKATPTQDGFDILAINAGEAKGHGITFGREVLMQSIELYNALPVFIDHAGFGNSPSVRNLAGTLQSPSWNEREQGIQAKLKASGPAAEILLALREAALTDIAIMQTVGFSCVVNVQLNKSGEVTKITRVKSVDVVIDPARGGRFLSAYSGQKEMNTMTNQIETEQAKLTETQLAALELQGVNERIADLQGKQKQANDLLLAQCSSLLETSLTASKLPAASQKALRKSFDARIAKGETFTAIELQEAITEKREELSEINAGQSVQGVSRIGSMMSGKEEFTAALTDLLGAEREEDQKKMRVRPLSGIREAYLMATGDQSFMGGYYGEYALVTANFPGIIANIQNKMLLAAWKDLEQHYGWWKKIATVDHFNNLNDVAWIRTGTISSLPTVAERGEYTELAIGDNKETDSWEKFGGYVPLTIEAVLRDDIRAFRRMPRELAMAGIRNISEQIAEIFTTASAAGPTMADGGALFNSTAVTTAGGHANLLTTALGTDYTAWNTIAAAMYNQPMLVKNSSGNYGTGKKVAIDPSFVLVPRALKNQAEALFVPRWEAQAQNVANVSPSWGGRVEVLTVPEWTDATDYAAVIDPKLVPGVMIGEIFGVEPQIFSASSEIDPAMFANDESRIKVRQFLAVGVADYIPLHKSNVA